MVKQFKTYLEYILICVVVILLIILLLLFLPIYLLGYPVRWRNKKKYLERQKELLTKYEGGNFFCYIDKKAVFYFIEEEIKPYFQEGIIFVLLEGDNNSIDIEGSNFIYQTLQKENAFKQFPQLLKVRNGNVYTSSVNNEVFNAFHQGHTKQRVFDKMDSFFELE